MFDKIKLKMAKPRHIFHEICVQYAEVIESFGKILHLGLVIFIRAFTDPGVRTLETHIEGVGNEEV